MRKEDKIDMIGDLLWKFVSRFVLAIVGLGLPVYALRSVLNGLDHSYLAWLVIILVFALPLFGLLGYLIARLEVRGFLKGTQQALNDLAQAIDVRDNAKLALYEKLQSQVRQAQHNGTFTVGPAQSNDDAIEL